MGHLSPPLDGRAGSECPRWRDQTCDVLLETDGHDHAANEHLGSLTLHVWPALAR